LDGTGKAPEGADFGHSFADLYREVCPKLPRAEVPAAFYAVPPTPAAVLLLSGGLDPATPPRHGERVAHALGDKAKHVVVPNAGHGVMGLPCLRDVVYRFVDADSDDDALKVDAGCASGVPRPPMFAAPWEAAK
jgi:pimeloyl-ACP methyl ester carboxylesterase